MKPSRECIRFLSSHQFIRNFPVETLIQNNNDLFLQNKLIWYCVGTIENKRYVHCIEFLKKTPRPGITSYYVRWHNTAPYSNLPFDSLPWFYDTVEFWVHSGVALRKNFFLFQDRMSLLRSTFYYDRGTNTFYRLASLLPHLSIPEEIPLYKIIYTTTDKKYQYHKRNKKNLKDHSIKKRTEFCKNLKKFLLASNVNRFLESEYPKLFQEANSIILNDGNTPRFLSCSK